MERGHRRRSSPFYDDEDIEDNRDYFPFREKHEPFYDFHHGRHRWSRHMPFEPHRGHGPHEFFPPPPPHLDQGYFPFPHPHPHPHPHHNYHGFPHFYPHQPYDYPQWAPPGQSTYDYAQSDFFQQKAMTQGYNEPYSNYPQYPFTQRYNQPNSNITINLNMNNENENIKELLRNRISSNNNYNYNCNYNNNHELNNNLINSNNKKPQTYPIMRHEDTFNLNKINSDGKIPISNLYNNNEYILINHENTTNDRFILRNKPPKNINNINNNTPEEIANMGNQIEFKQQIINNVKTDYNTPEEIANMGNQIEIKQQIINNVKTDYNTPKEITNMGNQIEIKQQIINDAKTDDGAQNEATNQEKVHESWTNEGSRSDDSDEELHESKIPDIKHKHELINYPNLNEICTICQQIKENKQGYKCEECEVILCEDCSKKIFYGKKITTLHPHNPLFLVYRNKFECSNCKNSFNNSTSFWCEECKYYACLSCYIP